jgi:hypothetical protein
MHKNLSGIPSTSSSKPSSKSKNPLRGSYGKLTLDLNKFELRSIAPSTTTASGSQPFSPTGIPLEKVSLITNLRKSPRTGHNPISFPTDGLESKETYTIDNKIFPQTTKAAAKGYVGLSVDKTKKTNERVASPKNKDSQLKSSGLSYETFLNKRGGQQQTKESLKTELGLNRGDSKTRITDETAKKGGASSSMTLNTVYTSVGSNSHRAQISSPIAGEHGNANRPYMYVPLHRRNSQKSESDFLQQYQLQSNTINSTKNYVATNFTIDQSMTSQDQIKNVSKLNMNSIANAFNTEKTISSPKEGPGYNGLVKMSGSSSATQDKKIKATIGMLTEEIDSFKRMKSQLRDKERLIETLQYSICEAVKDSDNLRKELQKSNLMPYDITPSTSESPAEHKRTKKNLSIGDMETVKTLVSQLKALTECSEEIYEGNSRVGNPTKPKSKRPESSGGFDHIFEKNASVDVSGGNNNVNIYQRHYSGTFEDTYGQKAMESPYYEALKTISRKEETHHNHSSKPSTAGGSKKSSSISKKTSPDVRKTGNSGMASQKDKDSLLGTPRKIQVESTRIAKQPRTQHNTMTGGELDILKRKFSHDPRVISEGAGDLFAKKHSGGEAGSTLAYTTEKESSGENIDIGKSLGMLKDRIANLLFRHKDDNMKLKEAFCANLQKFEGLLQ